MESRTSELLTEEVDCKPQFEDPYTGGGILSYYTSRRCMVAVRIKLYMVIVGLEVFMVEAVRLTHRHYVIINRL